MSEVNRTRRSRGYWIAPLTVVVVAVLAACSAAQPIATPTPVPTLDSVAAAVECESLATAEIADVTIIAAESIAAGSYQPAGSPTPFADLPAFCRVTATVSVAAGSSTGIEVWLPTENWNQRYLQVGTNGFGGVISWAKMAPQLQRGFATAATDSGHLSPGGFNASWAFDSVERIVDFAGRSVHSLAVNAKLLIAEYYGQPAAFSYHSGASTGGRAGLSEAQRYPEDFDGILAGTAIQYFTSGGTQMLFTSQQLAQSGFAGEAGAALLTLAQRAAITACDGNDGVLDAIVDDPRECDWDPHAIVCATDQNPKTCLSEEQADALAAVFAPLKDPVTKKTVSVGQTVSSEGDWNLFILNPMYSLALYQIGLDDPAWNGSTFDLHADLPELEEALDQVNATDPDLSAFEAAGGKLIQYNGWEDAVAQPLATVAYYDSVLEETAGGDLEKLQAFYRLFMLPGVSHVGAGAGPFNFGQDTQTPVSHDAEHDAITALMAWVEQGVAPELFIASKLTNNNPALAPALQRPICPYPAKAVYDGTGTINDAANFNCA